MAPATSPATPATSTWPRAASAAATPSTRLAVETMPSFAPSTAARSQPMRAVRCRSRWYGIARSIPTAFLGAGSRGRLAPAQHDQGAASPRRTGARSEPELAHAGRAPQLRVPRLEHECAAGADARSEGAHRVAAQVAVAAPREVLPHAAVLDDDAVVVAAHCHCVARHLPAFLRRGDRLLRARLEGQIEHVHAARSQRRRHATEVGVHLGVAVEQAERAEW